MSFRSTISWILFPLTMWYGMGVRFRNFLFNIGIKKQVAPPVTTIGVGNICVGGAGKTPHVEYLLRLLSDQYPTALLSRGYHRSTSGFQVDDGTHSATKLGDEPAMIATKFPHVQVAVCEKRLTGVSKLLAQEKAPRLIVLDDAFQHRYVKPTINILLTEYGHPYFADHVMPYGNLREPRSARFRANIVIVTKSPENLNPIERHSFINQLDLQPYQKVFFSYIHYCNPQPLMGGASLPLSSLDSALIVTGIANPDPMVAHVKGHCQTQHLRFADHHNFSANDIKHIRKQFDQLQGERKVILTTEKDAARLRLLADKDLLNGLPIYSLPIEVRIHENKEYNLDETIQKIVLENNLFQEKMKKTPLFKN